MDIQNPIEAPNEGIVKSIMFNTNIIGGELKVQCIINYQAAKLDAGVWTDVGGKISTVVLGDILNLDPDLAHLQNGMNNIYNLIVSGSGNINNVRKVL